MSNPFWPQELQFQSDQKISKHIRKHLYIPMFSSHSGSLGHLRSKKIWIIAKNHSIESSSNKDSKCNLLLQITTENLQKLADATITFVLQVKFATRLQLWTMRHFSSFHSHRYFHLLSDTFQLTKQLVPADRPPHFIPPQHQTADYLVSKNELCCYQHWDNLIICQIVEPVIKYISEFKGKGHRKLKFIC